MHPVTTCEAMPPRHTRGEDALAPIAHLDWPEVGFGQEEADVLEGGDHFLQEDLAEGANEEEREENLFGPEGSDERGEYLDDADLVGWGVESPIGGGGGGVGVPALP